MTYLAAQRLILVTQAEEATTAALPSNSLATDLQKGQFFPTRGQAAQARTTADMESMGDIIYDVHAQEEHAKAIAHTAEVCASAAATSATMLRFRRKQFRRAFPFCLMSYRVHLPLLMCGVSPSVDPGGGLASDYSAATVLDFESLMIVIRVKYR